MLRTMMTSKIHRATVTQADLHYVGSVTVDEDLLDAADLLPGELVHIVDVTNGARLETYTIAGERGSGVIGINGAAARLVHPGDIVILIGYGQMDGLVADGAFDLHGSVRELPSISAYASASLNDRIAIYGGVRTGVITLTDAQLYVPEGTTSSVYTLSSTSFEFGAPLGVDFRVAGELHITAEVEYMRRIFNSLTTDPSTGFPSTFPRTLNLSGLSWSLGVQLPLR